VRAATDELHGQDGPSRYLDTDPVGLAASSAHPPVRTRGIPDACGLDARAPLAHRRRLESLRLALMVTVLGRWDAFGEG